MRKISDSQKKTYIIELSEAELAIIASAISLDQREDYIKWVNDFFPNIDVDNIDIGELSESLNCCLC